MSLPTKTPAGDDALESVIIKGDLAKLTPDERVKYYHAVCKSVGLNPLTRPFEYITLNGKLTLYALRACADQLRQINKVSLKIVSRDVTEGILTIHVQASLPDGRVDEDLGCVAFPDTLKGEARANAELKAITKAKRRATLSICGLGWLDETEVESIPGAKKPPVPAPNAMEGKPHPTNASASVEDRGGHAQSVGEPSTEVEVIHFPNALQHASLSMKELAEAAQAAARQGEVAFKEFWRPLTVAQRSMLGCMGEELRKIMDGQHDPMTGEVWSEESAPEA
jgi:hypothetical protein